MRVQDFPPIARKIFAISDAMIVGSTAEHGISPKRDIDILVPFADWSKVAVLFPDSASLTNLGGVRFEDDGIQIDIWPGCLMGYLHKSVGLYVFSPRLKVHWRPHDTTP